MKRFDLTAMNLASFTARQYLEKLTKVIEDRDWKKRCDVQECQICYYLTKIGGAAITTSRCYACYEEMIFNSTNIDHLCIDCARERDACKHCGADMGLKMRTKEIKK